MNKHDFLELIDNDTCEMFFTPITDNEPIYTLLNVPADIFIYGLSYEGLKVIHPISKELLGEMLSRRETKDYYDVIYICDKEVNNKNNSQPVSENVKTVKIHYHT